MMSRRGIPLSLVTVLVLGVCGSAWSQAAGPAPKKGVDQSARFAVEEAKQQALQRSINGDLGLDLPAVTASSPRDSMIFADRDFVNQEMKPQTSTPAPTLVQVTIPAGVGGTGTTVAEILWYQLPENYVPGDPRPMVIAWHGFGFSANSVQLQSTVDEECNARGWIYLAVTGLDPSVFGTPGSQQNVEAAINYMFANFSVDHDRLYMAGWSMGGGCCTSFAARHRDPNGIMIAALGIVSGTFDWAETYVLGDSSVKTVMQNPLNFGGSVIQQLFRYQQVSTLYDNPGSYPPAPGTVNGPASMGDNLDNIPVYMTWDTGDPLVENPPLMGASVAALISSVGGTVETHVVSGTVDPITGDPKPHSWAVLDEVALFDFFATKTVNRTPAKFKGQVDHTSTVDFVNAKQFANNVFTFVDGDTTGNTLKVQNVANADALVVDVGQAGFANVSPLHLIAQCVDAHGYSLRLTDFGMGPSYLLKTSDGSLITGVESDPATGSLITKVAGNSTLDVQVISEPWSAKLSSTPDPVALGANVTVNLDSSPGTSSFCFFIISTGELLTPIKDGYDITASLLAPSVLLEIPLNGNGDFSLLGPIPNVPSLSGMRLPMQVVAATPSGHVDTVSNLWGLHVQ